MTGSMLKPERLVLSLDRLGLTATLLLPVFLTHGRVLAEIMIDVLAIGMLLRSWLGPGWTWTRQYWFGLIVLWWVWQMICSLPLHDAASPQALTQACLAVRFPLMVAALQSWTLASQTARAAMRWALVLCCGYFALQFLIQAVTGHNLFGYPRFMDGTLTGPYAHPRAAGPFSRIVLPVLMLGVAWLDARYRGASSVSSAKNVNIRFLVSTGILISTILAIMVLAGQRVPLMLAMLGIAVCATLYRPLRASTLIGLAGLPLIVLLTQLIAPMAFHHLIIQAASQLSHFWRSHYGLIFTRAVVMAQAHPVMGLGYDAFRYNCATRIYQHGLSWMSTIADGGGDAICVQHAHNHYLQALTNAGIPGLVLFCGFVLASLRALWPNEGPRYAWRIGLFSAFLIQEWPLASGADFLNLPLGGWAFILLGIGLAEASANDSSTCHDNRKRHVPRRLQAHEG